MPLALFCMSQSGGVRSSGCLWGTSVIAEVSPDQYLLQSSPRWQGIVAHSLLPKTCIGSRRARAAAQGHRGGRGDAGTLDAGPQRSMAKLKVRKATLPWIFVGLSCIALLVLHRSTSHLATDRDAHYKEELQRLRELAGTQITTHQTTRPPAPAAAATEEAAGGAVRAPSNVSPSPSRIRMRNFMGISDVLVTVKSREYRKP